jgi:hypothetical protein
VKTGRGDKLPTLSCRIPSVVFGFGQLERSGPGAFPHVRNSECGVRIRTVGAFRARGFSARAEFRVWCSDSDSWSIPGPGLFRTCVNAAAVGSPKGQRRSGPGRGPAQALPPRRRFRSIPSPSSRRPTATFDRFPGLCAPCHIPQALPLPSSAKQKLRPETRPQEASAALLQSSPFPRRARPTPLGGSRHHSARAAKRRGARATRELFRHGGAASAELWGGSLRPRPSASRRGWSPLRTSSPLEDVRRPGH